jgi:hypothetical protein
MRLLLLCLFALASCRREGRPAVELSAVTCGPCEARADDFARVRVQVLLRDGEGAPVRGARVFFGSADSAITDEEGVAFATFSSGRAGAREVPARLPDGTCVGSVAVTFFAGSLPRADFRAP